MHETDICPTLCLHNAKASRDAGHVREADQGRRPLMETRIRPEGKRDKAERLKELRDRLAHEDQAMDDRLELQDEVRRLERRVSMRGSR